MSLVLKVKKTHKDAVLLRRATAGAAAYDLSAALDEPVVVMPGKTVSVSTGIAVELPSCDTAALVFSRSGLGVNNGVCLINSVGVIDSDYRGTISLGLINLSSEPFRIEHGDRLAQLMVVNTVPVAVVETQELEETERGLGGFCSTGVK